MSCASGLGVFILVGFGAFGPDLDYIWCFGLRFLGVGYVVWVLGGFWWVVWGGFWSWWIVTPVGGLTV